MEILLLNYEYPPLGGGGGASCKVLAEGWRDIGHSVTVLTSCSNGSSEDADEDGIRVIRMRTFFRRSKSTTSFLTQLSYLASSFLAHLLKKIEFDVINTHFVVPTGPLGHVISKFSAKPNILSIHGADIYDPSRFSPNDNFFFTKLNSYLLNSADAIVAQSSNTKNNAFKYYDVKGSIHIIPLAYNPRNFEKVERKELGLQDDKVYLVSVGRLVKRKGFKFLVEALSLINDELVELLIIGEGPEKGRLEQQAKSLGIQERVHLLGYVPEEKKFQYLDNADIYVLSSLHEGFGIVLQEAMQVGLPIVATNNGGQVDLIEDGVNGLLVRPGNTRQLVDGIRAILTDSETAQVFSHNNRKRILKYNYRHVASQYLALFKQYV